jgi:hypothetical protein
MRSSPTPRVFLALTLALGCGLDEAEHDPNGEPPITGRTLYRVHPGLCFGDTCRTYTLYREANDVLELRAHSRGEYVGRNQADLHPDTAAQLDALTDELTTALANDEIDLDPSCPIFHDAPTVDLILADPPDTILSYDMWCEPDGIEPIDTLLYALLDDVERCRPSQRISPRIGCESLTPDWND